MPRTPAPTVSTPTSPIPTIPTTSAPVTSRRARSARANRRPHPDLAALKERAFALTCTGLRSPAIAIELNVPERTVRRWVNSTLLTLAQDALDPDCDSDDSDTPDKPNAHTATTTDNGSSPAADNTSDTGDADTPSTPSTPGPLERQRALAIERQLSLAVTAHAAYDRLMTRHDDLLDSLTTVLRDNLATAADRSTATAAAPLPPAAALLTRLVGLLEAGATRNLRLVQTAHREAARFQGVTAYAQADARLSATEAHETANAEPENAANTGVQLVPIQWVDSNDSDKEGLVPRHTFDGNAAIDDLLNAPKSSLDKLQQADDTDRDEDDEDDEDDEQDEDAILAAILAEQVASTSAATSPATPSATVPATAPAIVPATGNHSSSPDPSPRRGTSWRSVAEPPGAVSTARSVPDAPSEDYPQRAYDERKRLLAEASHRLEPPVSGWDNPGSGRANTLAALFMRNPNHVF